MSRHYKYPKYESSLPNRILTPMKYGDKCCRTIFTMSTEYDYYCQYFDFGRTPIRLGSISDQKLSCFYFNCTPEDDYYCYGSTRAMLCSQKFSDERYLGCVRYPFKRFCFEDKLIKLNERKNLTFKIIGAYNKVRTSEFRRTPVPKLFRWKSSGKHYHHGRSRKGLQFSSYKKIFDQQVYSYEDDSKEINYFDTRLSEKLRKSGMRDYDYPLRHQPRRSWKRTKKLKQWM